MLYVLIKAELFSTVLTTLSLGSIEYLILNFLATKEMKER